MEYTCGSQNEVMVKYLYTEEQKDATGLLHLDCRHMYVLGYIIKVQ